MSLHKNQTGDNVHAIPARTYADIAARDTDTAFHVATNIDKLVRIESPISFWALTSVSPAVWVEFTNTEENLWDRSGTTLIPKNAGDDILIENTANSTLTVKSTSTGSVYANVIIESQATSYLKISGLTDADIRLSRGGQNWFAGMGWNTGSPTYDLDYYIRRSANSTPDLGIDRTTGRVYTGGDLEVGGNILYSGELKINDGVRDRFSLTGTVAEMRSSSGNDYLQVEDGSMQLRSIGITLNDGTNSRLFIDAVKTRLYSPDNTKTLSVNNTQTEIVGGLLVDDINATSLYQPVHGDETGLVLDIPFEQYGTDTTQYDKSSYGYEGVSSGGVVINATNGEYGSGGLFDGIDGKIDIPYSSELNPYNFSIEVWVKVDGGEGTFRSIICSRDDSPKGGYTLYASDTDTWQFMYSDNTIWKEINSSSAVVLGEWTHIAASFDGTTFKLYVNGILEASLAGNYTKNPQFLTRIGAGATEGTGDFWFNGAIDHVKMYDRALSLDEIRTHYLRHGGDSVIKSDNFKIINTNNNVRFNITPDSFVYNDGIRNRLNISSSETNIASESGQISLILDGSSAVINDGTRNRLDIDGGSTLFGSPSGANFILVNDTKINVVTPLYELYDGTRNRIRVINDRTELLCETGIASIVLLDQNIVTSSIDNTINIDGNRGMDQGFTVHDGSRGRIQVQSNWAAMYSKNGLHWFKVEDSKVNITGYTEISLNCGTGTVSGNIYLNDTVRNRLEMTSVHTKIISPNGVGSASLTNTVFNINGIPSFTFNDGTKNRLVMDTNLTTLYDAPDQGGGYLYLQDKGMTFVDGTSNRISVDALKTTLHSPDDGTQVIVDNASVWMTGLPTADPVSAGALWNDSGTLKISAG